MVLALMVVLAVSPSVRPETVKCPRCGDVAVMLAPIVAASYDACFEPGPAGPTKTATVRLDVARDGAVSRAKLIARGSLNAAQGRCVVKVLQAMKLPASKGSARIELGLEFAPTPPLPPEAPSPHGNCPAPGHWDEATRRCEIAPCAGIPGGCPRETGIDVLPPKR